MLRPKLFTTLKSYDRVQFTRDAIAGVIVGIVALPLAIAFAIASGVTPDRASARIQMAIRIEMQGKIARRTLGPMVYSLVSWKGHDW